MRRVILLTGLATIMAVRQSGADAPGSGWRPMARPCSLKELG